jgi:hypothetical protein
VGIAAYLLHALPQKTALMQISHYKLQYYLSKKHGLHTDIMQVINMRNESIKMRQKYNFFVSIILIVHGLSASFIRL